MITALPKHHAAMAVEMAHRLAPLHTDESLLQNHSQQPNLAAIQRLLVCSPFDTVKGVIVNDHQIERREIRGSLKLQKGIGFEKRPIWTPNAER